MATRIKYFGPKDVKNMPVGWYKLNKDGSSTYLNETEQERLNKKREDSLDRFTKNSISQLELGNKIHQQIADGFDTQVLRQSNISKISVFGTGGSDFDIDSNYHNVFGGRQDYSIRQVCDNSLSPGIYEGVFTGFEDGKLKFLAGADKTGKSQYIAGIDPYYKDGSIGRVNIFQKEMDVNDIIKKWGTQLIYPTNKVEQPLVQSLFGRPSRNEKLLLIL